jgi:hypothetical protein
LKNNGSQNFQLISFFSFFSFFMLNFWVLDTFFLNFTYKLSQNLIFLIF